MHTHCSKFPFGPSLWVMFAYMKSLIFILIKKIYFINRFNCYANTIGGPFIENWVMSAELLHLLLWGGAATLVPNSNVHRVCTEQGGSSHSTVAVCTSSMKNYWPWEHRVSLVHTVLGSRASWSLALSISACMCTYTHMHTDWTYLDQLCCTVKLYWVHKNDTLTVSSQLYQKVIGYDKILWFRYSDLVLYTRSMCIGVSLHML